MDAYIDEAGTARNVQTVVVAAVMINPIRQAKAVDEAMAKAVVSHELLRNRKNFYFHCKDIVNDRSLTRAQQREIICIPIDVAVECGLTIVLAIRSKWEIDPNKTDKSGRMYYTSAANEMAHGTAFMEAVYVANAIIEVGYPDQIMSVFAEDCPQMKRQIRGNMRVVMNDELRDKVEYVRENYSKGFGHVRNGVNFCDKVDSPSLQIADAFAFGYSRYLQGGEDGKKYMRHMRKGFERKDVTDTKYGFDVFNYGTEQFPMLDLQTPMMSDPHWLERHRRD